MDRKIKALVLFRGGFSGITNSLISTLRSNGCEVIEARVTLRCLRYRLAWIFLLIMNALIVYRTKFSKYINRTYAAFMCMSKANEELAKRYKNLDVIIQIGANYNSYWKNKDNSVVYTLFTDHTNMLSKQQTSAWYRAPETHARNDWNKIEKKIYASQDHLFVMGSHVKESMKRDYAIDPNKISVVGAGPNLDLDIERDGVQKRYDLKTLLFVGIDSQRKGLHLLLQVFDEIVKSFPDTKLNIAGVEGKNTGNVTYHGLLRGEALKKLFYDSQIFVLPTFREPFGIVLLEAMFAKNACIASRTGAIPEIIEDQKTGFLVDIGDVEALKEKIITLLDNPVLLEAMGEEGYKTAKNKWTWNLVAQKMIKQLNDLITIRHPDF